MRVVLIVLDSVGIGEAPDAAAYTDTGSATLQHIAEAVGGLTLPTLQRLGLGNIPALREDGHAIDGVPPAEQPEAHYGLMQEVSEGKDTITGHWELAGLELNPGFHLFPVSQPAFPEEITTAFAAQTGRGFLGNKHSSGTAIVNELGEQALREGAFIIYTSADSVFQIAAHTEVIPLPELYAACEIARGLCDPYRVGRVIARPFTGKPGSFKRTKDRVDYAYKTEEPTLLERLHDEGIPVCGVGKIEDIFARRGISHSNHTSNNLDSQNAVEAYTREFDLAFIFANFIDFDMLYGHRRDPQGYAQCLEQTDAWLEGYLPELDKGDILIITADHGNDPTFTGTDHTREQVPLLVFQPGQPGRNLGLRMGFYDVAQSVASALGIAPMPRGKCFL